MKNQIKKGKMSNRRKLAHLAICLGVLAIVTSVTKSSLQYNIHKVIDDNDNNTIVDIAESTAAAASPETTNSPTTEPELEKENVSYPYLDSVPLDSYMQNSINSTCEKYGIESSLIFGLIEVESDFDENAVSSANCYGLMQLNPQYFPANLDPEDNTKCGIEFLSTLLDRYDNDLMAALTAYNAGHDTGDRYYANKVVEKAKKYGFSY